MKKTDLIKNSMQMPIRLNPYEHQIKAYRFALDKYKDNKGVAFLMEMGTGKSASSIAVAGKLCEEDKIRRLLIVAPKSIVTVWLDEFEKFAEYDYTLAILDGS